MKKLFLYSYSKCSTCLKAINWLDNKAIKYELIDIVKSPPSIKYLNLALKKNSKDIKKIFNTRGKSYKTIDYDVNNLSREKIFELLCCNGKLIKRPFLVIEEKQLILGFNESEYATQIL